MFQKLSAVIHVAIIKRITESKSKIMFIAIAQGCNEEIVEKMVYLERTSEEIPEDIIKEHCKGFFLKDLSKSWRFCQGELCNQFLTVKQNIKLHSPHGTKSFSSYHQFIVDQISRIARARAHVISQPKLCR